MDNKNGIQVGSLQKSLAGDLRLDHQNLNDRDLYNLCQKYGSNARMWKRKFASLLPEVEKRKLYKKYKFYSIYEFAAKLGGLSHKTVEEILRIYRRVESKPLLKEQVEKIGWGKVRAVSSLINEVKEENLVEMIENLPKQALEESVRLIKKQKEIGSENLFDGETILDDNVCGAATPPGWGKKMACESDSDFQKWKIMSFKLDPETEFRLRKFQQKLQKEKKEPVSFNNVLKELLDEVEKNEFGMREGKVKKSKSAAQEEKAKSEGKGEIESAAQVSKREKQKIKKPKKSKITTKTSKREKPEMAKIKDSFAITVPRYVNVEIRRILDQRYHGKCAFPGCNKPHTILLPS